MNSWSIRQPRLWAVFTDNEGKPDSETSIYAAFQSSEIWIILHGVTGLLVVSVTILTLIALSFAARYSWGTTGLSALLFLQLVFQTLIAPPRCHSWSPASTQ